MADTVLASGPDGYSQLRVFNACGVQLLAVSQAFPDANRVELSPAAVIRMIALMMAALEVSYPIWRDQQSSDAHVPISAFVDPAMLAKLAIQVAQVAVSHVADDGTTLAGSASFQVSRCRRQGTFQAPLLSRVGLTRPEALPVWPLLSPWPWWPRAFLLACNGPGTARRVSCCLAGRKCSADQVLSIDTWRTGCAPWAAAPGPAGHG